MSAGRAFAFGCGVKATNVPRCSGEQGTRNVNLCLNERQAASQEAGSHAVAWGIVGWQLLCMLCVD